MDEMVKKFTDSFDKTFVLTIARATDRHERIGRLLDGCSYELYMGVDGQTLDRTQLQQQGIYSEEARARFIPYQQPMPLGQIACSWGHRKMYQQIIDHGWQHTLILEDDIALQPSALTRLPELLAAIPADADLIYWGAELIARPEYYTPRQALSGYLQLAAARLRGRPGIYIHTLPVTRFHMVPGIYYRPYNAFFDRAGAHYGTHAYSITPRAAQILRDLQTPIGFEADLLLMNAILNKHIKAYVARTQVFLQDKHTEGSALPNYNIY